MDPTPLTEKVAIVTGGSRGIGRAVAMELASYGARVMIGYRSQEAAALEVIATIRAAGGQATAMAADVGSEADVRRLVRAAAEQLGPVDVLVCNAGITRDNLLGAMSLDDWDQVININLRGPFLCIREVLPDMFRRRSGSIVVLSSIAATMGGRGHANYVASKGGIEALVRSLAIELAPRSIRVNAVAPGIIETDMTSRIRSFEGQSLKQRIPLGRFGVPEDVARAVRFLASAEASYVTGVVLPVSGGLGL